MLTFYKKYGRTAFDILLIVITIFLIMFLFSFLYRIGKPIFIAFIIFLMIEPLARFLHKKGLKKIVATTISTLLFILVVLAVVTILGIIFAVQITHLSFAIPKYIDSLQQIIIQKADVIKGQINTLPPDVIEKGKEYLVTFADKSSTFLSGFFTFLSGFLLNIFHSLSSISSAIINFALGLILAFFLSIEIMDWKRIAKEKTPKTFKHAFFFLKDNVFIGLGHYVKAQLKLISFTFVIVFIGLIILGINNAFSIALLSAFFDLLPLLGVSTLFIPWIIYLLIVGHYTTGLLLLGLLTIVIVFRQLAEPKVVGDSLGVSAFTMLSFMVISLSLFGVIGIFLSPVLLILSKALIEQGYLKKWIHLPTDEYDQE